jgi:two-component system, chemotaxis family, chemotaxis protein CheY
LDKSQLRNIIRSGRAIVLDCHAIGKSIPKGDPIGPLFQTDIMNKSVLMKRYQPALATARQDVNVGTVIYFPYDFENPYDGGESVDFNGFGFPRLLRDKISHGADEPELLRRINIDVKTLSLIDSMHSLDPFMFKSKAEQQDVDKYIHPAYFAITSEEWDKIRLPIREKIAKLVTRALGGSIGDSTEEPENKAREQYIELFLMKIWQAKDIEGIEPFVNAMQISPDRAPELFFAWKAVCYYQVRFDELAEDLKTFFQWIGNNELCFPANALGVSQNEQDQIIDRRDRLRVKMRDGHITANQVIKNYESSYNQFINADKPKPFMEFLGSSENSYLNLASHVSVATHSNNLWKWYMAQYGAQLRHQQFLELFNGLRMLYGVTDTHDVSAAAQEQPIMARPQIVINGEGARLKRDNKKAEDPVANMRVLLVEDTPPMAELIRSMLAGINVRNVKTVPNGKIALDEFLKHRNKYDIIVSDWVMPLMTGIELLHEVRALDRGFPFMMLTVRAEEDEIQDARDANVTAYLTKPFKARSFQANMSTMFDNILAKTTTGDDGEASFIDL